MNGYFLTLIIIYVLSLGVSLSEHGKPRTGEHNFFNSLFVGVLMILLTYFAIEKGF